MKKDLSADFLQTLGPMKINKMFAHFSTDCFTWRGEKRLRVRNPLSFSNVLE